MFNAIQEKLAKFNINEVELKETDIGFELYDKDGTLICKKEGSRLYAYYWWCKSTQANMAVNAVALCCGLDTIALKYCAMWECYYDIDKKEYHRIADDSLCGE